MARLIVLAALAGLVVALSLGTVEWYIYSHGVPRTSGVIAFERVVLCLWPAAIMNAPDGFGVACDFLGCALLLAVSSVANAMLYAAVAFCAGFAWTKIFKVRSPAQR
jgi:hypothetical protein